MLTDATVKNALPPDKAYKLADIGGLFLYVAPTGLKQRRFRRTSLVSSHIGAIDWPEAVEPIRVFRQELSWATRLLRPAPRSNQPTKQRFLFRKFSLISPRIPLTK